MTIAEFERIAAGISMDIRRHVVAQFEPEDWEAAFAAARALLVGDAR